MTKKAVTPTGKLQKCYFNANQVTVEAAQALGALVEGINGGDEVFLYETDEDLSTPYVSIKATQTNADYIIVVEVGCDGEEYNSYGMSSQDTTYGTYTLEAGHWYNFDDGTPVSGEIECAINSAYDGLEEDMNGNSITLEKNTLVKDYIYEKEDEPEPEPETKTECQLKSGYKMLYENKHKIKATKSKPSLLDGNVLYLKKRD